MGNDSYTQSTWIVAFLFILPSVPIIYIGIVWKDDHCFIENRSSELEFLSICDFNNFRYSAWVSVFILGFSLLCVILDRVEKLQRCDKKSEACCERTRKGTYFVLVFLGCGAFMAVMYFHIQIRLETEHTNWNTLHADMKRSLEKHYKVDSVNSSEEKSNSWNMLFVEFECCGINRINGTTNDFDNTPWCTTNGSCQSTASQIPKSCCKNLNEFDYQTAAPSICHASVNPGTYHEKGCFGVIKKEIKKKRETLRKDIDGMLRFITTVLFIVISFSIWNGSVCNQVEHRSDHGKETTCTDESSNKGEAELKTLVPTNEKCNIQISDENKDNESNYDKVNGKKGKEQTKM